MGGEPSRWKGVSDAGVIERSLREPEAFGVIFDRHFNAVHGYLARRIGRGQADDLAASAFSVAFERRHRFRADATTARPWLLGIATNLLRNARRAEKRSLEVLGYETGCEGSVAPSEASDVALLGRLLGELDQEQRDVLLLYAWEDLTYEDIAHALGIPVGTVRSRLARARSRLRAALNDEHQEPAEAGEVSG